MESRIKNRNARKKRRIMKNEEANRGNKGKTTRELEHEEEDK